MVGTTKLIKWMGIYLTWLLLSMLISPLLFLFASCRLKPSRTSMIFLLFYSLKYNFKFKNNFLSLFRCHGNGERQIKSIEEEYYKKTVNSKDVKVMCVFFKCVEKSSAVGWDWKQKTLWWCFTMLTPSFYLRCACKLPVSEKLLEDPPFISYLFF